jgi:hypothetical protein
LPELLSQLLTERYQTLGLLTLLGVVAAQRNVLLADGTPAVRLPLALPAVGADSLHLVALQRLAVGISALEGMHQVLDAMGNGVLAVVVLVGLAI